MATLTKISGFGDPESTSGIFCGDGTTKLAQTNKACEKKPVIMNGTSGSLRKLPPMSPRREGEEEDVYATVKKSRKKKLTVPEERGNETNLGMSTLSATESDRSTKNRRSNRHISRSREDVNESQQLDSTPQRKKRKKKEPASDLSPPRNMPQKSSAGGEDSLGSRRKLTFTSGTNGSVRYIFRNSHIHIRALFLETEPTSILPLLTSSMYNYHALWPMHTNYFLWFVYLSTEHVNY